MSKAMRELMPYYKNIYAATVLLENYGQEPHDISYAYFGNEKTSKELISYANEFINSMASKGFFEEGKKKLGINKRTELLLKYLEDRGIQNIYEKGWGKDIESAADHQFAMTEIIEFIYESAEYAAAILEKRKLFEDSKFEAVIVPPVFDESIFAAGRE